MGDEANLIRTAQCDWGERRQWFIPTRALNVLHLHRVLIIQPQMIVLQKKHVASLLPPPDKLPSGSSHKQSCTFGATGDDAAAALQVLSLLLLYSSLVAVHQWDVTVLRRPLGSGTD